MKKTAMIILFAASFAFAVAPQKWSFRTYDDFLRGRFDGMALNADGVLSLAPREDILSGPAEEFYLSLLAALDGTVYVGTGHSGRIFRIPKDGPAELYFQAQELDVTSLAFDAKGVVYAGTSPHGKIYKITAKGEGTAFFDPAEKYIWDLMFDGLGNLLAAVGEGGGIYEINAKGQGRLIFKAPENHILCLRRDRGGNILAGSGGGGSVYRIAPGGKAQVVFESPFEEVRALAVDGEGNILAAAGGLLKSRRDDAVSLPSSGGVPDVTVTVTAAPAPAGNAAAAPATKIPAAASREPGALYRLSAGGTAQKLWSSSDEMIYALAWNEADKRILFGTGPKGRFYALDREDKLALLVQKNSEQVYLLAPRLDRVYVLANNPPQITALFSEQRLAGEYLTPVQDAKILSAWGRLSWEGALPQGTVVQVLSRSGNTVEPGPAWSDWSPPYQKADGEPVLSPKARYAQFRILMKSNSGRTTPTLSKLNAFYLQTNVAPVVGRLDLLNPNEVLIKPIEQDEAVWGLERRTTDPPAGRKDDLKLSMAKRAERSGFQTVLWDADDENGDALTYALWIKTDADAAWRLLEDRWTDTIYAFATTNLADGIYTLKVTATDRLGNPPGTERTAEKTSAAFVIDNTPPVIKSVQSQKSGGGLDLVFLAEDQFSAIKEVKILVRPDDWRIVFPVDGICDSRSESFQLKIPLPAGADSSLVIVARDAAGNTAVFKTNF